MAWLTPRQMQVTIDVIEEHLDGCSDEKNKTALLATQKKLQSEMVHQLSRAKERKEKSHGNR